jgi:hypothetical protein
LKRINCVFGDYFLGGRQFDKLDTLISYFMFYSELVKNERLLHPLAPLRITRLEKTYISKGVFSKNGGKKSSTQIQQQQIQTLSSIEFIEGEELVVVDEESSLVIGGDEDRVVSGEEEEDIEEDLMLDNEEILSIDKEGELFLVFHNVNEDSEWLWAKNIRTNKYGLLNSRCVTQVVCVIIFF